MPMGLVRLRPGINTQLTLSANEAGMSRSQLVRFQSGLIQKYGGWTAYDYAFQVSTSPIRDMHAWQGLSTDRHLAIGSETSLTVYHSDTADPDHSGLSDITPQTLTTNPTPSFSVSSGSSLITVVDAGSSVSVYDTVFFNTPVAVGGLLLNGAYPINTVGGPNDYTIVSSVAASVTASSSGVVPLFDTSSGSAVITVTLPNNGFQQITGLFQQFIATTSVGGLTIQGPYQISGIIDSTQFQITADAQASSAASRYMNSASSSVGTAQLLYYKAAGPPPTAGGYGTGGYGDGGYGTGTPITGAGGTPITADEWTLANWGEALLACPQGGPIYLWSGNSGFSNATVIAEAPFFNGGIFVAMPQQILVAWASTQSSGVEDPLVVRWCDAGDYTNWTVSSQTAAGSFHIPTGSEIVGGMQAPSQALIWTDIDVWAMTYVGGDVTFNFQRIGSGCGLIGPHAMGTFGGAVYWCGITNFFMLGDGGVRPIDCPVWDFIFQNLSTANQAKIRCAVNSAFSEVAWFFPSAATTGENDSYVKMNVSDPQVEWDYGTLSGTAWVDTSILGNPIRSDSGGLLWEHETGNNAGSVAMTPYFESGWWSIAQGNDLAFVDFIIPDMQWGTWSGSATATVLMTFYTADYPGGAVRTHGPFSVTQASPYINARMRGRLMRVRIESQDLNSFWRIGLIRFRWATSGRR